MLILTMLARAEEPVVTEPSRAERCETLIRARRRSLTWSWVAFAPTTTIGGVLAAAGVGEVFGGDPAGPGNALMGSLAAGAGVATYVVLQVHAKDLRRQIDALECETPTK